MLLQEPSLATFSLCADSTSIENATRSLLPMFVSLVSQDCNSSASRSKGLKVSMGLPDTGLVLMVPPEFGTLWLCPHAAKTKQIANARIVRMFMIGPYCG